MRWTSILLVLFLLPFFSCSQLKQFVQEYQPNSKGIKEEERVNLVDVDIIGFFTGCPEEPATIDLQEWGTYLQNNLVLDNMSVDTMPAGNYTVFVQFVIDKEGRIRNVSTYKDPGYGLGQKVVKIISSYKGLCKPATINGRPILNYHIQPVTFIVEEQKVECEDVFSSELIL